MRVSENTLKWAMRFYPPLFFQRVWVQHFEDDFFGVKVKLFKSILNQNYNRSIFGGTIFNAADPFYPILLHYVLLNKGYKTKIWVKRTEVDFIKPAYTSLFFHIRLNDETINRLCRGLNNEDKLTESFLTNLFDKNGQLCCTVKNEVYIRHLKENNKQK